MITVAGEEHDINDRTRRAESRVIDSMIVGGGVAGLSASRVRQMD
jgi:hypothetical protein